MESIIKHLVEITGHRDHELLNISVISALAELMQAEQARVLSILSIAQNIYIKPQIQIVHGILTVVDDSLAGKGDMISQYPELQQGILQHDAIIEVQTETRQIVWVPIWINDKLNACIEIVNPAAYSENTKDVMHGILIVYRNFQNLLDYSESDSLTGLLNRKTFEEHFSKITRSAQHKVDGSILPSGQERRHENSDKQHWLAVLDIDHFKRVNDQFGHLYGDEVLILLANRMRASFRPSDKLFRFGGEEFVILLRSATLDDAQKVFERFRQSVEEVDFPQVGRVTVSIGFALLNPSEAAVGIMGRADQALYFAKTHGRNRTCHYESLVQNGDLVVEKSHDDVEFF